MLTSHCYQKDVHYVGKRYTVLLHFMLTLQCGMTSAARHSTDKIVPRLIERHFPERIPPTEKKARPTKRCVVCYKNNRRKETVFWCPECEAALCVEECFKAFHTKLNF